MESTRAKDAVDDKQDFGAREANPYALVSLFLGIIWLFGLGSLAAIYLGARALREIRRPGSEESGRAFAWGGILTGIFGLTSVGLIIAVAVKA